MIYLLQRGLPILVLLGAVLLRIHDPVVMSEMRMRIFDIFQWVSPRAYVETPVKVIDIDNESLQHYGQWPWPRSLMADLITRLTQAGAKVIALDIVFPEKDRTGPEAATAGWGLTSEDPLTQAIVKRVADPDDTLATAFKTAPVVLGFILTGPDTPGTLPKRKSGMAVTGGGGERDPRGFVPRFSNAISSLPDLQKSAKGLGSINLVNEGDAIVRRLPTLIAGGNTLYPSLVSEALRVSQKASTIVVKASGSTGYQAWWQKLAHHVIDVEGIAEVKIGRLTPLTDEHGQIWLYDSGRIPARTISAWRVLAGEPLNLKDSILFIGTSAPGLLDLRATPNNPVTPGVEIHAQIAEQILTGVSLNRPYWTLLPELAFLIVLGGAMILLLPRVGPVGCAMLGAAAMSAAVGAAWYAFIEAGQLFDPIYPGLAALVVFIIGSLSSYFRSDVERRAVRSAFSHYLAPAMVEQLASDPSRLRLGGEMRLITVLFCDIRDFTTLSEQTTPEDLTLLLNRFLTPMSDAVLQHRGTIDKYIGDSIMAFWNAPLDDPHHADHACLAALEMRQRLAILNGELELEAEAHGTNFMPIRMGIGINSGACLVGNLGSQQRFNYSVMGDDVNLASRIEGQTKNFGIDILIGGATERLTTELALLPLGEATVKGKLQSTQMFAVLGGPALRDSPFLPQLKTLLTELIAALGIGDTRGALHYLSQCRLVTQHKELEPLYEHIDAAILRRERDRKP